MLAKRAISKSNILTQGSSFQINLHSTLLVTYLVFFLYYRSSLRLRSGSTIHTFIYGIY